MSRRGNFPNVNASLIHEARMLFQQFIGGRQENYYSMKIAEAQAKAHPLIALKCAFCATDAVRIINGQSVCVNHEAKARGASNRPLFPGE